MVSLLPGLTELVCKLGLQDRLVGRSHECDFPKSVTDLPVLTSPGYPHTPDSESGEIHRSVTGLLQKALSIYDVDDDTLIDLNPDIILTQDHCEVCAVTQDDLSSAVKQALGQTTEVVSVSPTDLEGVCQSFIDVADTLGVRQRGEELAGSIQSRFDEIRSVTAQLPAPDVVAIEWIEPLMTGGNWMPEMIEIAGGVPHLATAGKHSPWQLWEDVVACDPDVLLIVPCGFGISKTKEEMTSITEKESWQDLTSVRQNEVYLLDGNHYFNRPGPRIKESVEILAEIFHPDVFKDRIDPNGWVRF
ncbi:cobalamin-binding protein [Rhodohalobacter sp.]|uniref:cobalamin-binding protein n=1 Tax=Rhodohalobacter sp. TaxID=1974210 RepID=UPI002ACE44AB|nr:cobalamin-binding protein [Rhodohalobacter sp.]MDZ7757205.1 cobalamin-binding protein [Rhodohalobacter sp.]